MKNLINEILACDYCKTHLPLKPNPVISVHQNAKIIIIGQAPGIRVHNTNIPWNDPSGEQLRIWLNIDDKLFYDEQKIAIVPMGFCYPGKGKTGDLPPRPECAPKWHDELLNKMPDIQLTLLIGQYAQKYYLKEKFKKNLTETVKTFEDYLPNIIPLPHPSPRNRFWLKKNDWFELDVIPVLQKRIKDILKVNNENVR